MNSTKVPQEVVANLYEKRKALLSFVNKILDDQHRSEEIVQEAFFRLSNQDYDHVREHLNAWMFTVCRNLALKLKTRSGKCVFFVPSEDLEDRRIDESLDPQEMAILNEYKTVLRAAIKKLSKKQQNVLKNRFFKQLDYNSTAKRMNTTSGNVGFIQNSAINKLRKLMDVHVR